MNVINSHKVRGTTYVQYEGKDYALWWPESVRNPTDGNSLDTDEIDTMEGEAADLRGELAKLRERMDELSGEIDILRTLKRQQVES